jgi:hypothetical protein
MLVCGFVLYPDVSMDYGLRRESLLKHFPFVVCINQIVFSYIDLCFLLSDQFVLSGTF